MTSRSLNGGLVYSTDAVRMGAGGTIKDGVTEIQGEHCEQRIAAFKSRGLVATRSGG